MIFPDKLVAFQDSIIAKSVCVLKALETQNLAVSDLFVKTRDSFEDISEFLLALDALYLIGKIEFNDIAQVIEYVKEN